MITELLTTLVAAEKTAQTAVAAAVDTYRAARKSGMLPEKLAAIDPGHHKLALGNIRAAINALEQIVNRTPPAAPAAPAAAAALAPSPVPASAPPTPPGAIPPKPSAS